MSDPTEPENQFVLKDRIQALEAENARLRKRIIIWTDRATRYLHESNEARRWARYYKRTLLAFMKLTGKTIETKDGKTYWISEPRP